jgi:hypothetical protein
MFKFDDFDTPSPASTEARSITQIIYSEGTQMPEYLSCESWETEGKENDEM